jgi:subtilase family serine protease
VSRPVRTRAALLAATALSAAALALGTGSIANAAPAPHPSPSPSWQQVPSGPTGSQLPGATAFGDTPGDTVEHVSFVLSARDLTQLQRAVLSGQTSGRRQQLSVAQFAARYGQSTHEIAQLTGYLARFGIRSTVLPNHLDVETTGTTAAYNRALNVTQKQYHVPPRRGQGGQAGRAGHGALGHTARQQNVHAPTRAPQLPPQLARDVTAIFGLSNYSAFASDSAAVPLSSTGSASPQAISPATLSAALKGNAGPAAISADDCTAITTWPRDCNLPQDFAAQYGLDRLTGRGGAKYDGTGQTIGIVTFSALDEGAAEDYWANMALIPQRPRTVTVRNVDGGPGAPDTNSTETDLDVQQAGGVAPGANVVVYQAPNTDAGGIDALFQAASENLAGSVSMSWSESETLVGFQQATGAASRGWHAAFDLAFLELAAQGQSTFVAGGDAGAYSAYVEDPLHTTNLTVSAFAASPYVTAAGGTTLPFDTTFWGIWGTADLSVPSERAWAPDYLWAPMAETYQMAYSDAALYTLSIGVGSGGGGYSTTEPQPSYQRLVSGAASFTAVPQLVPTGLQQLASGVLLPTAFDVAQSPALTHGRATGRAVPDLSADADSFTGYFIYSPQLGGLSPMGGTSIVAPQFAGAAAVIAQANGARTGFWNPSIYQAAAGRNSPFTPLSAAGADNDNLYYTGTPGTRYNPATGLGTPDFARLARVFAVKR